MVVDISSSYSDALRRVYIKCLVRHCVFVVAHCSTAGIPDIAAEFGTTDLIATLGITTYVLGFAFGPLFWAPMSEARGRRPVYLVSWFLFTVFQIPCALAKNPGKYHLVCI
jgi:MFS family permease